MAWFILKKFGLISKIIKDKVKKLINLYNSLIINGNGIANSSAVMRKNCY